MPRSTAAARATVTSAMMGDAFNRKAQTKKQETRPCLLCGKPHEHSNGFCSAECCKIYMSEHPVPKVQGKKRKRKK